MLSQGTAPQSPEGTVCPVTSYRQTLQENPKYKI
jgi:hypothetical protein